MTALGTGAFPSTSQVLKLIGSSTGYTAIATANASTSNYTLTLPAINDTLVTLTATQTLTNKTFTSPSFASPTLTGTATLPDSSTWTSSGLSKLTVASSTASTSTSTGSIVTPGGVGIAKNVYVGGSIISLSASVPFTASGYTFLTGNGANGSGISFQGAATEYGRVQVTTAGLALYANNNGVITLGLSGGGLTAMAIYADSGIYVGNSPSDPGAQNLVIAGSCASNTLTVTNGAIAGSFTTAGALTAATLASSAPVTVSSSTHSQAATESSYIITTTSSLSPVTLTLVAASTNPGRQTYIKQTATCAIVSASSNIVLFGATGTTTTIVSSTSTSWATLISDGVAWQVMAGVGTGA